MASTLSVERLPGQDGFNRHSHHLDLINVSVSSGLKCFGDQLQLSSGRSLIVVHPFYSSHKEVQPLWRRLGQTLTRTISLNSLPILLLQGVSHDLKNYPFSPEIFQARMEADLTVNLKQNLDIKQGVFFYLPTENGNPIPYHDTLNHFLVKLKNLGLKKAWVMGTKLIQPEPFTGCVPIFFDSLKEAKIEAIYTQLTFPDQVNRTNQPLLV